MRYDGNYTSCYTFHTTSKSWYDAVSECKKEIDISHLVSIGDSKEQDYLVDLIRQNTSKSFLVPKIIFSNY